MRRFGGGLDFAEQGVGEDALEGPQQFQSEEDGYPEKYLNTEVRRCEWYDPGVNLLEIRLLQESLQAGSNHAVASLAELCLAGFTDEADECPCLGEKTGPVVVDIQHTERTAGLENAQDVPKRQVGVREVLEYESGIDKIEGVVRQVYLIEVAGLKGDVGCALALFSAFRDFQQGGVEVETGNRTFGTDKAGELATGETGATPEVEHVHARGESGLLPGRYLPFKGNGCL